MDSECHCFKEEREHHEAVDALKKAGKYRVTTLRAVTDKDRSRCCFRDAIGRTGFYDSNGLFRGTLSCYCCSRKWNTTSDCIDPSSMKSEMTEQPPSEPSAPKVSSSKVDKLVEMISTLAKLSSDTESVEKILRGAIASLNSV